MKILQLCKKFPYPLRDGESIAVTYLSRAMHDLGADLTLLAMNTRKHYTSLDSLPEDFDHYSNIHCVPKDNRFHWSEALVNLFSSESLHIQRYVDEQFNRRLTKILSGESFDIIQLETLYMAPYVSTIRDYSDAAVVMRAHNVEYEIWQRLADNCHFWPKKWYLQHLTNKLQQYEEQMLDQYDYLVAITKRDLEKFRKMGYRQGATIAPIGIDMDDYDQQDIQEETQSISFIGSLDWHPNLEGLDWFVSKVWPSLVRSFPESELHIAGRNTPQSVFSYNGQGIRVHGEVPSSRRFLSAHPIMIVPLFSGSGMRAKILEGMALGRVVITTSLGLEGIPAEHGREVLVADTAEAFVKQLSSCFRTPQMMRDMGGRARSLIESEFDNERIAETLLEHYQPFTEHAEEQRQTSGKKEHSYSSS